MLLIVTQRMDPHVEFMEPELDRRGIPWARFHLSSFPVRAAIHLDGNGPSAGGQLTLEDGRTIDLAALTAIWYRRTERLGIPTDLEDGDRKVALQESQALVNNLWASLAHVNWVSHPRAIRNASDKLEQILRARRLGLRVPETVVSNDSMQIADFYRRHAATGGIVYKPQNSIMVREGADRVFVTYTKRLCDSDLKHLDAVAHCPGIFQQHIPKDYELRVTVFGDRLFACSINSQGDDRTRDDWRAHDWQRPETFPPHSPAQIDDGLAAKLLGLVHDYGLQFGAIDLIVPPEGEPVFVELNPNGQWAWIEQCTGIPLRSALADLLAGYN